MGWTDLLKSKEEKEFDEFFLSPKEHYEKVRAAIVEKDKVIAELEVKIKESESEYEDLRNEYQETTKKYDRLLAEHQAALDIKETLEQKNEEVLEKLIVAEKANLKREFEAKVALKEAQLEKDYHHEVHTFLESQQDRLEEMTALIFEKGINSVKEIMNENKKLS